MPHQEASPFESGTFQTARKLLGNSLLEGGAGGDLHAVASGDLDRFTGAGVAAGAGLALNALHAQQAGDLHRNAVGQRFDEHFLQGAHGGISLHLGESSFVGNCSYEFSAVNGHFAFPLIDFKRFPNEKHRRRHYGPDPCVCLVSGRVSRKFPQFTADYGHYHHTRHSRAPGATFGIALRWGTCWPFLTLPGDRWRRRGRTRVEVLGLGPGFSCSVQGMPISTDLLDRIRERADSYDRANEYFGEDLAELKETDYFRLFVPEANGGVGLTLPQMIDAQMSLAGASGATALSVNMHHIWMGVARQVHRVRPGSLDWIFDEAVNGEIYAFGIS